MLVQLEIKDFAIIEHSIINFENGLNVITGETGAGKSILLDALNSILGERTSKSVVRKDKDKAELKAVFYKSKRIEKVLEEKGIDIEDDIIILKRTISKSGRSMVKINGSIQTTQTVKDVCSGLIEICGQKAHLDLLNEDKYLYWIDEHSTSKHKSLLNEYFIKYKKWKETNKKLEEVESNEREKEQLLDLYRFQKEEIEVMDLKIGEDAELEEKKYFLSSFEKVAKKTATSTAHLESINDIYQAKVDLEEASESDKNLKDYVGRIEKAYYELEDVKGELENYISSIEFNEEELNHIMHRLDSVNNMKRKYADTIDEILEHHKIVTEKLNEIENKEEVINNLKEEKEKLEIELRKSAKDLHVNRQRVAKEKQNTINKVLKELCMPNATLEFDCEELSEFNHLGNTSVSILFNANKGEDLKPLSKIASGGELSRVLLAMQVASNQENNNQVLVFDEVDEGIGGEVGRVVGRKLYELGKTSQVICISHLPQVAAKGDIHFSIEKRVIKDRTISKVKKLSENDRKNEIARMIYGDEKNETTIKQAEEMLKKSTTSRL